MAGILIMDGGMGRQLERMGAPFGQPEWSAKPLLEAPHFVARAHRQFIRAGAGCITTNSYAVVPYHIGEQRYRSRGKELIALAARLAREAAGEAEDPVLVAGCIPPIFGSYCPEEFHPAAAAPIVECFMAAQAEYVDLWLVETVAATIEMELVAHVLAARSDSLPLWVSFTVQDDLAADPLPRLRSGEPVQDAVHKALEAGAAAVLFNCSQPESMLAAVETARQVVEISVRQAPIGVQANAFAPILPGHAANVSITPLRRELTPSVYADFAERWVSAGATILGGCCGIGPEHIAALHNRFG